MKDNEYDIFVNQRIYPNAKDIFSFSLSPVNKIKDDCIIVLDTNALLVPYLTGSDSLNEIKKVFEKLKEEKRLVVPGQVAREFANNRPEKLKDIFQQLNRKQNSLQNIKIGNYPLLEGIDEYKEALELEEELNGKLSDYRKKIGKLIKEVKSWNWDDPVSKIYKKIFTENTIIDIEIDKEKIKKELSYRYFHKIPPGFKDDNKPDDGIGDYLIWLTILNIAEKNKDVIFVSGDEKTDWYHRSEKKGLYPRFELVNEFKIISNGKSFHILRLSELLDVLGADDKTVKEVAKEEKLSKRNYNHFGEFARKAELSIARWITSKGLKSIKIGDDILFDLIIENDNGVKSGIEVIPIDNNRPIIKTLITMHDFLHGLQIQKNSRNLDRVHLIVVAQNRNYSFRDLISRGQSVKDSYESELFELKITYGFLNEKEEFCEIK